MRIFIAYAREDRRWFEEGAGNYPLIPHLQKSLQNEGVTVWWDKRIPVSAPWKEEIEREIDNADLAILIISQDFLNSDFIKNVELPRIEQRTKIGKLKVTSIIVGYCDWRSIPLVAEHQILYGDETPLIEYINDIAKLDKIRFEILEKIRSVIKKELEIQENKSTLPQQEDQKEKIAKRDWKPYLITGVLAIIIFLLIFIWNQPRRKTPLSNLPLSSKPEPFVNQTEEALRRLNIILSEVKVSEMRENLARDEAYQKLVKLCFAVLGKKMVIDSIPLDVINSKYKVRFGLREDDWLEPSLYNQPETLKKVIFDVWKERHFGYPEKSFDEIVIDTSPHGALPNEIIEPKDGDTVRWVNLVILASKREASALPAYHQAWIVVYPHSMPMYHPQMEPAKKRTDNIWQVTTYLGKSQNTDIGDKFDIYLVLADTLAGKVFRNYLKEAERNKNWPGLYQLPRGAKIFHRITVTRR